MPICSAGSEIERGHQSRLPCSAIISATRSILCSALWLALLFSTLLYLQRCAQDEGGTDPQGEASAEAGDPASSADSAAPGVPANSTEGSLADRQEEARWPAFLLSASETVDLDGQYRLNWEPPGEGYTIELQESYAGQDIEGNATGRGWEYIAADLPGTEASFELSQREGHSSYSYRGRLCSEDDSDRCSVAWEDGDEEVAEDAAAGGQVASSAAVATVVVALPPPENLRLAMDGDITYGGRYELSWQAGDSYHAERRYYIAVERRPLEGEEVYSGEDGEDGADSDVVQEDVQDGGPAAPIFAGSDSSDLSYRFENYIGGDYRYHIQVCTEAGCSIDASPDALLTIQDELPAPLLQPSTGIYPMEGDLIAYGSKYRLAWSEPLPAYEGSRRYELRINDESYSNQDAKVSFEHTSRPRGSKSSYEVRLCVTPVDAEIPKCSIPSNVVSVETVWLTLPEPFLSAEPISDDSRFWRLSWPDLSWARGYYIKESSLSAPLDLVDVANIADEDRPSSHSYTVELEQEGEGAAGSYEIQVIALGGGQITSRTLDIDLTFTEGSWGNPIKISDCNGLDNIRSQLDAHYRLVSDIDADCIEAPIGSSSEPFSGGLAGHGYLLYDLNISSSQGYVGLFGVAKNAEISRLGLKNTIIAGGTRVGALVGQAINTEISNVYGTVSVRGRKYVGGLVGYQKGGTTRIGNVYTVGWVEGKDGSESHIGGIVGGVAPSALLTLENSYSLAWTSGNSGVGGLVGSVEGALTLEGGNYFRAKDGGEDGIGTEGSYCLPPACEYREGGWLRDTLREQEDLGWDFVTWKNLGKPGKLPCLKRTGSDDCSAAAYTEWLTSVKAIPEDEEESLRLEWQVGSESAAASYIIYREGIEIGATAAAEYLDTDVAPHQKYNYTILPLDAAGGPIVDASHDSRQIASELYYDAREAMEAWQIDLDTTQISAIRNKEEGHIPNPPHWIGLVNGIGDGKCRGLGVFYNVSACGNYLGYCSYVTAAGTGKIVHSTAVVVKPNHLKRARRRAVMSHEIGHCIGMKHWKKKGRIMGSGANVPSPWEALAAQAVYNAPGDFCRPDNNLDCRDPKTLPYRDQCPKRPNSETDESWLSCCYYGHQPTFPQFVFSEEFITGEHLNGAEVYQSDTGASVAEGLGGSVASAWSSLMALGGRGGRRGDSGARGAKMLPKGPPLPANYEEVTHFLRLDGTTEEVRRIFRDGKLRKTVRISH